MKPAIGVCYFPEHWPEEIWAKDAQEMVDAGIEWVRIAEFSWAITEPSPHIFNWDWLDKAVETLGAAGLKVILCTPTATPPKWLVDSMPDMLGVDAQGQKRGFGSRRHYSFSHEGFCAEAARIVTAFAERYGNHPAIYGWQTDNEYGCHDTAISYCKAAHKGFQNWLKEKYVHIDALNEAWGNLFWSQIYTQFEQIELPLLTVTEPNPSHQMDFFRYSSERVAQFNHMQTEIIRKHSPNRPIAHNFMGMFSQFDHRDVAADLDIISWDSYPLGMLQNMHHQARQDKALMDSCMRTGCPDFQAFHHDLYRGMGRLWVMEQQPGPVNWAKFNPVPAEGAVRLWSWEAAAHGAECISYFRWRQLPFGQEQMHAGLKTATNQPSPALGQAKQFIQETADFDWSADTQSDIALIYDYEAVWMAELDGQSEDFHHLRCVLDIYRAARQCGGSIDVKGPKDDLSGYKLILVPAVLHLSDFLLDKLEQSEAQILIGPRSAVKSVHLHLLNDSQSQRVSRLTGFQPTEIDALAIDQPIPVQIGNQLGEISVWHERGNCHGIAEGSTPSDAPLLVHQGSVSYLTGWADEKILQYVMANQFEKAGIEIFPMPDHLRMRVYGTITLFTNYGSQPATIPECFQGQPIIGSRIVAPADVAVFQG